MIRRAVIEDLKEIMAIYEIAKDFMRKSGNPNQWRDAYPSEEIIANDILNNNFYVEETEGYINGCFAFIIGEEPTYRHIKGKWPNENTYGTIHRLASNGSRKGLSDRCIDFCLNLSPILRADTHKDNVPMQRALERNGFVYCGIIWVIDGSERLAYSLP